MSTAFTVEGLTVVVEESVSDSGVDWCDKSALKTQYQKNGYVIARQLLPHALADKVIELFRTEVKPHKEPLLRQKSVRMEPHKFSTAGHMTNTLLSVQDLVHPALANFRNYSLAMLTHENVKVITSTLVGESVQCVESMYFESSSRGTFTHADSEFMDAAELGGMVAAWYALEDIHPQAGRFYVMPESHLLGSDAEKFSHLKVFYREYQTLAKKITENFNNNASLCNAALRAEHNKMVKEGLAEFQFHAPLMQKGDVIFWDSRVLHGSLTPSDDHYSRNSLTAHYIGQSQQYLVYAKPVALNVQTINGMPIHHLEAGQDASRRV